MSKSLTDEEVFAAALRIQATPDRLAYLEQICVGNLEQLARVKALLAALDDAGSFLNKPLADFAALGATATPPPVGMAGQAPTDPVAAVPLDFLSPCDSPDALGKLGPYIVEDVIGRGGMGIVLRAIDPKLSRVVAIKVLAPEFLSHPMAAKRFLREAQAAAAVSHDHVVRIYAVDDVSPVPFLVMECIVGQSLQQKIERKGILEIREILRIGSQIAAGLAAAHKQGLVHRDIKPANILLENGIERVKITDFGLARAVDDVGITQSGQVTGTPQYMSPEQAMGEQVDHRSDLFSLGSVLYTMCTGRPAFRATSTVAVLRRVVDDAPRPIRELNPDAPDWLIAVIDKLMSKKPEERFQTAAEVATVLEQWLAHYQRPQTVPAPAFGSPTDKISLAPAAKGVLRRAWDEWWSERDRWVVVSVQIVLVVLHLICMLAFLNFYTSRTMAGDKPQFQFWMGSPSPWYRLEINQGDKLGFSSGFYPFTWSVLMGLIGWALYYAVWRIEKARDPNASWWNRPEVLMSCWGLLAVGGVVFGTILGHGMNLSNAMTAKSGTAQPTAKTGEWQQLFNGRDLSGWMLHPDQPQQAWSVIDGTLVGRGSEASHLFTERNDFGDFHLRAEVKINSGGNSGIFLRSPFEMHEKFPGSKNPAGYELQIIDQPDSQNGYVSGAILPVANGEKNLIRPNQWSTVEVIAQGNRFTTIIDGLGVVDVRDVNRLHIWGTVALQVWGSSTEVSFRRIEVRMLQPGGGSVVPQSIATSGQSLRERKPEPDLPRHRAKSPNPSVSKLLADDGLLDDTTPTKPAPTPLAPMQFAARQLTPTLPPWAGAKASVKFEDGAWRIENRTSQGNFNVLMGTVLEDIPSEGLIVLRAQIKTEGVESTTPGALHLGLADGLLGGEAPAPFKYDWPESDFEFRGIISEWTRKEFRCPAGVFHTKNPPQLQVYVGLHDNGVVWVKDLELLHLPGGASSDGADPNRNQPSKSNAVLEELRKQVDLMSHAFKQSEASHAAGQTTLMELLRAKSAWVTARLRLAEVDESKLAAIQTVAEELVGILEERAAITRKQFESGVVQASELTESEQELSETRIRVAKLKAGKIEWLKERVTRSEKQIEELRTALQEGRTLPQYVHPVEVDLLNERIELATAEGNSELVKQHYRDMIRIHTEFQAAILKLGWEKSEVTIATCSTEYALNVAKVELAELEGNREEAHQAARQLVKLATDHLAAVRVVVESKEQPQIRLTEAETNLAAARTRLARIEAAKQP